MRIYLDILRHLHLFKIMDTDHFEHPELGFMPGELLDLDFPLVCDSSTEQAYEEAMTRKRMSVAQPPPIVTGKMICIHY